MQIIDFLPEAWIKRFQIIFILGIIASLTLLVGQYWSEIKNIEWQINSLYICSSIIALVCAMVFWAAIWTWLLSKIDNKPINLRLGMRIYLYGNLAKYLPGSLWNYFARGYMGYQQGYRPQRVWLASLIEFTVSICTGIIIYLISMQFPHTSHPLLHEFILFAIVITLIIITSPPIFLRAQQLISTYRHIEESRISKIGITWFDHLIYLLISISSWVIVGFAFCMFVWSIYPLQIEHVPEIIGEWSLSISLGMAVLIIPQGMGIREGYLIMSMSEYMPIPVALTIALLSRFWIIVGELIATAFLWIYLNLTDKHFKGMG